LRELTEQIEYKTLGREYSEEFRKRLRMLGRTVSAAPQPAELQWRERTDQLLQKGVRRQRADPRARTTSLLSSKIVQPSAPVSAHREALIVMAIVQRPWLLDDCLEEIASMHLEDADCRRIRDAMLTVHQTEEVLDNEKSIEHLSRQGHGAELERIERACAHKADPHFAPGATDEQVLEGWRHVVMLHGKAGLPRSLAEAESDYMSEQTSENCAKLFAVKQETEIAAS
jgi:DNA primase